MSPYVIAQKYGLRFDGIQDGCGFVPKLLQFTCPETGATFYVSSQTDDLDLAVQRGYIRKLSEFKRSVA